MSWDDDNDYGYHGGGYNSRHTSSHGSNSKDDARRKYEELKAENLRSLKNIDFENDEKGQSSFLGMPISKDMKPVLEMALDTVKPFVIDQSDKFASGASALAKSIGFAKSHATTVGLVAENVFRWGIVGAKQIFDSVKASNKYSSERRDLFAKFSPLMQATGSNMHNNEVIRVAYDEVHQNWLTDMKKMAADLPTLIPTAIFAWEDQRASAHKGEHAHSENASIDQLTAASMERVNRQIAETEETNKLLVARRRAIETEHAGQPNLNELLRGFDTDVAPVIKRSQRDKWNAKHTPEEPAAKAKNRDMLIMGIMPITALLSQTLKSNVEAQAEVRRKRVKAWKMIEHLKEEMESHCADKRGRSNEYDDCEKSFTSRSAEDITVTGKGTREGESLNLKEYIIEVFQQHERDREPNRSFYDKGTNKAIDPLKGTMLTNLMPAVEIIAEHMADGTLSGDALYKLVGENKVIEHSKSGARVFAKPEQVSKIIEEELSPVLGTREVIKLEEFMAKFADPALIQGTLKKNLESMQGQEKALFASLFPDDILVQAGMAKSDIFAARRQAHEHAYDFVAATVMHLSKKTPEELKAMGVTEGESKAINALAEKVDEGDIKAIKLAVDGRDKEVIDAVRTAGLLEQVKGGAEGGKFWTERVKEMGAVHTELKKKGEERKRDEADTRGGDKADRDDNWSRRSSGKHRADSGFDRESHTHMRDRDAGDSWADSKESGGFSSRIDAGKGKGSARDRLASSRDSSREDTSDFRAI
jgi:hypothetical protein